MAAFGRLLPPSLGLRGTGRRSLLADVRLSICPCIGLWSHPAGVCVSIRLFFCPSVPLSGHWTLESSGRCPSVRLPVLLTAHRLSVHLSVHWTQESPGRCLSACLSVHLSVCLSICQSIHLSVHLSVRLSVHALDSGVTWQVSVCPPVCLPSVHPSVCPSICLSVHLSVCLSMHWTQESSGKFCLPFHLSVYPSVFREKNAGSLGNPLAQDRAYLFRSLPHQCCLFLMASSSGK